MWEEPTASAGGVRQVSASPWQRAIRLDGRGRRGDAERFGQPAKTEDVTGMALPNRLIYYHAQDETGKPVLAKLRFISVCKPESANTDCYRLSEVSAAPAQ
jgi:hypothetical protein